MKGFTLIELLVVVLIIGILSAVALPQYEKAVMRSRFTQMVTAARSIVQAQHIFYMENGEYTADLNDLDVVFPDSKEGAVSLREGSCNISTPPRVVCILHKGNAALASLVWFYDNNVRICYSYRSTNFAGDSLCSAEMKNDDWYDGCGGDGGCHCYTEK